jgi:hypothetical protein
MPKLAFGLYLCGIDLKFLFTIGQESQFSADTKIRNSKEWDLFYHTVSAELNVDLLITVEIEYRKWGNLHYIAYV